MVGTHAHEGSMVFQALGYAADDEFELPISSLLWHLNYWLLTGNQACLPDTVGSCAFAHLLGALRLPPSCVRSWNARHADASRRLRGDVSIAEELRDPAIGGLVRQDSGDVRAFVDHCFSRPIRPKIADDGKLSWVDARSGELSEGYKCLASEISSNEDVEAARSAGYMGMGTGGYLGEKPWESAGKTGPEGDRLSHRIDVVAKVSLVSLPGGLGRFFPVKLGDFATAESW